MLKAEIGLAATLQDFPVAQKREFGTLFRRVPNCTRLPTPNAEEFTSMLTILISIITLSGCKIHVYNSNFPTARCHWARDLRSHPPPQVPASEKPRVLPCSKLSPSRPVPSVHHGLLLPPTGLFGSGLSRGRRGAQRRLRHLYATGS